ncbi:MAG TPA: hypothetical protein VLV55_04440 [Rhizomicrobium sp.]|nr:hypothetical protein [Rhizomicrobium sp.]
MAARKRRTKSKARKAVKKARRAVAAKARSTKKKAKKVVRKAAKRVSKKRKAAKRTVKRAVRKRAPKKVGLKDVASAAADVASSAGRVVAALPDAVVGMVTGHEGGNG